jgi:hypothetical protein
MPHLEAPPALSAVRLTGCKRKKPGQLPGRFAWLAVG